MTITSETEKERDGSQSTGSFMGVFFQASRRVV